MLSVTAGDVVNAPLRLARVLLVTSSFGLMAGCYFTLGGFRADHRYWRRLGTAAARHLSSLGGAFAKLGQILSTRYDLLPSPFVDELQAVQDAIPPFKFEVAIAAVERALKRPISSTFTSFDPKPLGSGSAAQVHRAQLKDGTFVAVKIARPDAAQKFSIDLQLLRKGISWLSLLPICRAMPLRDVWIELNRLVGGQLDFQAEANWQRRFATALDPGARVKIPFVIDELSTNQLLVMQFLPGLQKLTEETVPIETRRRMTTLALRAVYQLLFEHGLLHCDLHPGNIYIANDSDAVVLLDFGLCHAMNELERHTFAEFFLSIGLNDSATAVAVISQMSVPTSDFASPLDEKEIAHLIAKASGSSVSEFSIAIFVIELFKCLRKRGRRARLGFAQPVLCLLLCEGLLKRHCPDLDFQREALPFVFASLSNSHR